EHTRRGSEAASGRSIYGEQEELAQSRAFKLLPLPLTSSSLNCRRLVFVARKDSVNAQASEAFFAWDDDAAHCRDHWRRNWRAVRRERADRLRLRCFRP